MKRPSRQEWLDMDTDEQVEYARAHIAHQRWKLHMLGAIAIALFLLLLLLLVLGADAQTRVDLFDSKSNRKGYAIIDPKTGRIDTFDARSNRTGYGTTNPTYQPPTYPSYRSPSEQSSPTPAPAPRRSR